MIALELFTDEEGAGNKQSTHYLVSELENVNNKQASYTRRSSVITTQK